MFHREHKGLKKKKKNSNEVQLTVWKAKMRAVWALASAASAHHIVQGASPAADDPLLVRADALCNLS
jgi:hypothetical protein